MTDRPHTTHNPAEGGTPPFDFRRHGHAMVDWIADYMEGIERFPVASQVPPGWVRAQLPEDPPEQGEPWDRVMSDLDRVIVPGLTHWQSPGFFAYFPANASGPSILGELLSAGLGVQGMLWSTSPACTELETHVMDWLAGMLDLPAHFRSGGTGGGVIQDTASSATLCAMIAARERATGFAGAHAGLQGDGHPRLVAYATAHAHSSIEKAARICGLGADAIRTVPTRADHSMDPAALKSMLLSDRAEGHVPFLCVASVGTTSSHAVDPVAEIGPACNSCGTWLHVDAAHLGAAALCPEFRGIHRGLEFADSYCFNPHKWMLVNFDCDAFWVRDRATLVRALSVLPEYLRNDATASGKVIDYRDWQVPLGRRFRALKLWFVIRHFGVAGLQSLVRRHVALSERFRAHVAADDRFELVAPTPWTLTCFRPRGASDEESAALLERVNATGRVFLSHTRLDGRHVIRFSVGAPGVAERHVDAAWEIIRSAR